MGGIPWATFLGDVIFHNFFDSYLVNVHHDYLRYWHLLRLVHQAVNDIKKHASKSHWSEPLLLSCHQVLCGIKCWSAKWICLKWYYLLYIYPLFGSICNILNGWSWDLPGSPVFHPFASLSNSDKGHVRCVVSQNLGQNKETAGLLDIPSPSW